MSAARTVLIVAILPFLHACLNMSVESESREAAGKKEKIEICHRPPGNPDNCHTLKVGGNAVQAHLDHGDFFGPCTDDCEPPLPEEICDGVDNDGDGLIDESDPRIGLSCNEGMQCRAGIFVCEDGQIKCQHVPAPDDVDGDGIPDSSDLDDDGDGIPDIDDEFPSAVTVSDRTIDFDFAADGRILIDNERLAEQYEAFGVHFESSYRIAQQASDFSCYKTTRIGNVNLLCTPVGASGGACGAPEIGTELVVNLDTPVDLASIDLRTRCDGPTDGDLGTLRAYDASHSILLAEDTATAHVDDSAIMEGKDTATVVAPGIHQLRLDPGDFDSTDDLRLVDLESPCP